MRWLVLLVVGTASVAHADDAAPAPLALPDLDVTQMVSVGAMVEANAAGIAVLADVRGAARLGPLIASVRLPMAVGATGDDDYVQIHDKRALGGVTIAADLATQGTVRVGIRVGVTLPTTQGDEGLLHGLMTRELSRAPGEVFNSTEVAARLQLVGRWASNVAAVEATAGVVRMVEYVGDGGFYQPARAVFAGAGAAVRVTNVDVLAEVSIVAGIRPMVGTMDLGVRLHRRADVTVRAFVTAIEDQRVAGAGLVVAFGR